jgi:prolyl oligopeptidase
MPAVPPITTRQVVYESDDGTQVRMFIVSADDVADRPRPTVLSEYGGFGVSMAPDYQPLYLDWVASGGVFAMAQIRGGGEQGERWHRAGMRGDKGRSFEDFAAAADWLVANDWTTAEQLGIYGASNGGMLMGAALTRCPEKWSAVVCAAALLDMVRYERSGLGPSWRTEYGTAEDPEQLGWLLSYSPYHQVREGTRYPAVLFTTFDADSRVDPLHARKMCAALQHASASGRRVLLRTEKDVGHSQRAVSRTVGYAADVLAFFATELGLPALLDTGAA